MGCEAARGAASHNPYSQISNSRLNTDGYASINMSGDSCDWCTPSNVIASPSPSLITAPVGSVCGMVREDVDGRCEDRLVELHVVIMGVEVRDRVCPKVLSKKICIRPVPAGKRVAVSADQNIRAISAQDDIVSSESIDDIWPIAAVEGRVDAGDVVRARIEHDDVEIGRVRSAVGVGYRVLERILGHDLGRQ